MPGCWASKVAKVAEDGQEKNVAPPGILAIFGNGAATLGEPRQRLLARIVFLDECPTITFLDSIVWLLLFLRGAFPPPVIGLASADKSRHGVLVTARTGVASNCSRRKLQTSREA